MNRPRPLHRLGKMFDWTGDLLARMFHHPSVWLEQKLSRYPHIFQTARAACWVIGATIVVASVIQIQLIGIGKSEERLATSEENQEILREVRDLAEVAADVTGPDAVQQQADYFAKILAVADCNNAERFNQFIRGLEQEGLLVPGRIVLNCP